VPRVLAALVALCIAVPAIALAANTDPRKQITRADQAKARSVLLKRSDFVAGWKLQPPASETPVACAGYDPNESDLTVTGEASADFTYTGGFPFVSSSSEVWKSKADALASWTRSVKPALGRCLAHVIQEEAKKDGGKLTIVSYGRMVFPKVAPRTVAYRIVTRLLVEEPGKAPAQVQITVHVVFMGYGRADAGLYSFAPGTGLAAGDLRAFARLIAARMAAAKL
jgi:hypothetical protein